MEKNEMLRILGSTVMWLIALTFFAYPALFGIIIDRTQDFCMKYYENQMQAVSIISNVGFLVLTIFDYFQGLKVAFSKKILWVIFAACCFIALIGWISNLSNKGTIQNYFILSIDNICFWFHGLFLLCLGIIKYLNIRNNAIDNASKVKGVKQIKL